MLLAAVHLVQAISRSRFWGTPLPIWVSEDMEEVVVVGSVEELQELTGEKVRRGRWGGGGGGGWGWGWREWALASQALCQALSGSGQAFYEHKDLLPADAPVLMLVFISGCLTNFLPAAPPRGRFAPYGRRSNGGYPTSTPRRPRTLAGSPPHGPAQALTLRSDPARGLAYSLLHAHFSPSVSLLMPCEHLLLLHATPTCALPMPACLPAASAAAVSASQAARTG